MKPKPRVSDHDKLTPVRAAFQVLGFVFTLSIVVIQLPRCYSLRFFVNRGSVRKTVISPGVNTAGNLHPHRHLVGSPIKPANNLNVCVTSVSCLGIFLNQLPC